MQIFHIDTVDVNATLDFMRSPSRRTLVGLALATSGGISVAHASPERPNALYAELLGKGGAWGIGYDHELSGRFAVGAVASFSPLDGQRLYTLSPYLGMTLVGRGHHHWFVDAGPQVERLVTPSPVPEWKGMTSTDFGAEMSSGYEYRDHFLFRIYGEAIAGARGVEPWVGISIGWTW